MNAQNQMAKVEAAAPGIAQRQQAAGEGKQKRPLTEDEKWARQHLRWQDGRVINDIANALRLFEQHPDYTGRFKYNDMVNRVLDKGTVMIDWRIFALCAEVQERFFPGMPEDVMLKALTVTANRAIAK